jgi:hypothetical protein
VKELHPENLSVVVAHEDIANYMNAMTMPFKVRNVKELTGLESGDRISFQLNVSESESWLEHIRKTGEAPIPQTKLVPPKTAPSSPAPSHHPLLDDHFNHSFRTLIIDASGELQTSFPVSGDLADAIVSEIRKGASVTISSAALPGAEVGGSK